MEYTHVKSGDENIEELMADNGESFVQFDAFFLRDINDDGEADGIRGTCNEIGAEDTLYMELKVSANGSLQDGVIKINSDNFYFDTTIPSDNEIQENVIGNNVKEIKLNEIKNGTQKLITGMVKSGDYTYDSTKTQAIGNNIKNYSKKNSITFTGKHVNSETGAVTQINKTVYFDVDWYGKLEAEILDEYQTDNEYLDEALDEENGKMNLKFKVETRENKEELILKKTVVEGTIPELNNYPPEKVEIENKEINFSYDKATRKFKIEQEAKENEETGEITSTLSRYNTYEIVVTYPIQAYLAEEELMEMRIPVTAYYEGYNNTNVEFEDPKQSNIAKTTVIAIYGERPKGTVASFEVKVGKYIYEPRGRYVVSKEKPSKIYNEIEENPGEDTYEVVWSAQTGPDGASEGIMMWEKKLNSEEQISDEFITTEASSKSMEEIVSNVGIYFSNAKGMLGEDGWIKVYDNETGELKATFTAQNWEQYNKNRPYRYEIPIRHIRIETSNTNINSTLLVYNIKEINDEYLIENYEKDQFDSLQYIKSTLGGYLKNKTVIENQVETNFKFESIHIADYEEPYAIAKVEVSDDSISTQETKENLEIKIKAEGDASLNQVKWVNGAFLLKLPKDIVDVEINDVTANNNVEIVSYETYEEIGDETYNFIKINTKNEREANYTITINCNITPDPRVETTHESIELYSYNENASSYYSPVEDIYDVNNNLNKVEKIDKSTVEINLISPNSLVTSQIIKDYDSKGSITVAPKIADVLKEQGKATLDISILNNYAGKISEVKVIGKVPKAENTYVINGRELGSTFSTQLIEGSLKLSDKFQNVATIYYSEKEKPNKDLLNDTSEWTKTPSDYSAIKTFLIDFGSYVFEKGEEEHITYDVSIPEETDYNEVSFAHHAVYFSLETEHGKYRTQVEPNKIGLRIAKYYNLELTKYQKGTKNGISGATYYLWPEGEKEGKTKVTGEGGKLTLENLYIKQNYCLKEIKTPEEYELSDEIIKFTTNEDGDTLIVTQLNEEDPSSLLKLEGTTEDGAYKVNVEVEDEVKANLSILKIGSEESEKVKGARFKLIETNSGDSEEQTEKVIITNSEGQINAKGLKIGQEYTLEEVRAEGYYLASQIKFIITHEAENFDIEITEPVEGLEEVLTQHNLTMQNEIPTVNFTIKDEKIPTYNLTIKKIEKGKPEELLSGAKFKLIKDGKEIGRYETGKVGQTSENGEKGQVTIQNLYATEESRKTEQIYTLQEYFVPEGYSKMQDVQLKVTKGEDETFSLEVMQGTVAESKIDGNDITITLEDNPIFKLTKREAVEEGQAEVTQGKLLPNTKFVIYNVENGTVPATNSKGELVGEKQEIDGKEYYVLETDDNGEISADLPQGMYKAVEVEASEDKYALAEETYFGIGASREGQTVQVVEWVKTIPIPATDASLNLIELTSDGGYIVVRVLI